jgi:mannitol/fructose-specific phosphotransferase system IIA component (Ntr-type)
MRMQDYTTDDGFLLHLDCATVREAVERLVATMAAAGDVRDAPALVAEVMRREVVGSTAIGGGLVIPHARFAGVGRVRVAAATLARPLDVKAPDGRPVDLVILLVGPADDPRRMLRVLAALARRVKRPGFTAALRAAGTPAALRSAFLSE